MENYTFYMINLLECSDRKSTMYKLYDNDRLKYVEAIDGTWISDNDEVILPPNLHLIKKSQYKINDYEIACTASHIKAIKMAYENNEQEAFIIEDDTHNTYKSLWKKNLRTIINNKPTDAECIIFFTSNVDLQRKLISNKKDFTQFDRLHTSTGIYYITREGMKKIYNYYVKNDKIVFPVAASRGELLADRQALFTKMKTYHYTRPTFIDECKTSTIHQRHLTIHEKNHNIIVDYFIQEELNKDFGIKNIIKEKLTIIDEAFKYLKNNKNNTVTYHNITMKDTFDKLMSHDNNCICVQCRGLMAQLKKCYNKQ